MKQAMNMELIYPLELAGGPSSMIDLLNDCLKSKGLTLNYIEHSQKTQLELVRIDGE